MINKQTKCRLKQYSIGLLLCITIILTLVFFVLAWGNPQWHKYIYMFQLNVYPKYSHVIYPPKRYTGRWIIWRKNGTIWRDQMLEDGVLNGFYSEFDKNGVLRLKGDAVGGLPHGKVQYWDRNGKLVASGVFKKGIPFDGTFLFSHKIESYKNGKKVNYNPP